MFRRHFIETVGACAAAVTALGEQGKAKITLAPGGWTPQGLDRTADMANSAQQHLEGIHAFLRLAGMLDRLISPAWSERLRMSVRFNGGSAAWLHICGGFVSAAEPQSLLRIIEALDAMLSASGVAPGRGDRPVTEWTVSARIEDRSCTLSFLAHEEDAKAMAILTVALRQAALLPNLDFTLLPDALETVSITDLWKRAPLGPEADVTRSAMANAVRASLQSPQMPVAGDRSEGEDA